jgi:PEGA domain
MYRVIAIVSGGLALAACSSFNLDAFKPAPVLETVRFESQPPGAEAKVSNGQTCRTPCALALPAGGPYTVTFTLNGYQPEADQIELVSMGDNTSRLQPNPVLAALTPAAPPPPAKRKPVRKKPAAKPAAKPIAKRAPARKPAPARPAAPPPMTPSPPAATSPWPAAPPQR